jgi:hypothetical protein
MAARWPLKGSNSQPPQLEPQPTAPAATTVTAPVPALTPPAVGSSSGPYDREAPTAPVAKVAQVPAASASAKIAATVQVAT